MYPDLSYFLHDLIGTQPDNWTSIFNTFGLFLGMTFFVAAIILRLELKRKEEEGLISPYETQQWVGKGANIMDVVVNGLVGFVFGFKVPYVISNFAAFKEDTAGVIFSSQGNWTTGILVGLAFGALYFWQGNKTKLAQPKLVKTKVHPYKKVGDVAVIAAVSGIFGARLFSILENMDSFWADPMGQIFSGSGLTIYGGLICGFLALYYYIKKWNIKPMHFFDALAPAYTIGYAVGRGGCQFSGDGDWGITAAEQPSWWFLPDWLWSYNYPHNVADFYQRGPKLPDCDYRFCTYLDPAVYPTPLYEIFITMIIFALLWFMRKRIKTAGVIVYTFCILNGLERFFIEKIRVNDQYDFLNLGWSQAQFIAIALIIIGIAGFTHLYIKSKGTK